MNRTQTARSFRPALPLLFLLATGCVNVAGLWHPVETDPDTVDTHDGDSTERQGQTSADDQSQTRTEESRDDGPADAGSVGKPPDRSSPGDDKTHEPDAGDWEYEDPDDAGAPDDTDSPPPPPPDPISVTISIDRETQYQTLTGFGAAIAWYGELLLQHPHRDELFDLAFRDLGLDILRLRNVYRGPEAPFDELSPEIVAGANASLGRTIQLLLSAWSPPAALKANGSEECVGNSDCTLKKDEHGFVYEAFANWWLESLEAYAQAGIVPDYISIQNEPDYIPPSWEGCRFAPTEDDKYPGYDRALEAVHERLLDYQPRPKLAGPEVIGLMYDKLSNYTQTGADALLDVVVHHLYDGLTWQAPHHYTPLLREAAQIAGDRPLLQTEFSVPGVDAGFETAWLIHNVLVEGNAAGYLYWDLIWVNEEGLISIESPAAPQVWSTPRGYTIRDEYYSVRHYAGFTDPGDRRIEATSSSSWVKVSAFLAPDRSRTTVVMLNVGQAPALVKLNDLHAHGSVATYRSANGKFFETLPALELDGVVEIPSRGIVTLVQR